MSGPIGVVREGLHGRAATLLLLGLLGGCQSSETLVKSMPWNSEAERVPEGKRFIETSSGAARSPAVASRQLEAKGLLGQNFYDIDGVVTAPRFAAYMHGLVDRGLAAYPGALPVRKVVIDASDQMGAFSTPEGDIWVSLGLIEAVGSESELAAALLHEAGHVELDHFSSTEYFDGQRKALTAGAGAGLVAITLSHTRVSTAAGRIATSTTDPSAMKEENASVIAGTWLINTISDDAAANWWQRGQEEQADLVSADLLAAAGFDPGGIGSLLANLGEHEKQQEELQGILLKRRDELVGKLMATDPMAASQDLSGHVLKPVMDVVGEFGMDLWGSLKHDHPRPQERQKWISTYVEARYEDEEYPPSRAEADSQRLKDEIAKNLPEKVRDGHHAANRAKELLAKKDLKGAQAQIRIALGSSVANSAHVRSVAYLVSRAQGRDDEALRHLRAIDPSELKPRRVFEFLSVEDARRGRFDSARGDLEAGVRQFGEEEPFMPGLIHVAVLQKDETAARAEHAKCRDASSDTIKLACDQAIAPLHLDDLEPAVKPGLFDSLAKGVPSFKGLLGLPNGLLDFQKKTGKPGV